MSHDNQDYPAPTFTTKAALVGLCAYIVMVVLVVWIFN